MNITVLMENTTADPCLHCEHGLSLYIETGDHKILFDMGQTAAFADNAGKLGVDLASVDLAVLSHGHYDHGGGIARFLKCNDQAPLYLSQYAFEPHFNGMDKYIGLDPALLENEVTRKRLRVTENSGAEDPLILAPGIALYACRQPLYYPLDSAGLKVEQNGQLIAEDFRHEQYLLIHEGDKRILFSGCSHRGILNIVRWFQPDVLVGGFHFSKWDTEGDGRARLDQAAQVLSQYDCTYYTCHCTGRKQYEYLKQKSGKQLHYLSVGSVLKEI